MMGLACLFMVACNNTPKQPEQTNEPEQETLVAEEHHCPFCPLKAEYANWDNMDDEAKAELNKKAYELFAEMEANKPECGAEGEHHCQHEMAEMTEEQKTECQAKCEEMKKQCEEMKAAWDSFETLNLDEQKDLILGRIEFVKGMQCHHEGEEHHCQHEGEEGHQCQHGEGHQCQHAE